MSLARIVVGLDGSANSARAAALTGDLAELSGAQVLAVHAAGLLESLPPRGETRSEHRHWLEQVLETTWSGPLRRAGVVVRCELHDGHPVDVLIAAINRFAADLVVVGSRGTGEAPYLLLGSTSAQLAQDTPCPILIVPDHNAATAPADPAAISR
jgi:nucleotide-binding universal stress UspA family protein